MRRRDLLKNRGGGDAFGWRGAEAWGGTDRAKTLVFVPTSDLTILDPVVTGARPTRNSAYLVFDTLYGIDTEWKAEPQMIAGHTVEEDGLTWTLKLRDGLRFHDNEPVLARDVVASIRRFAPRVIFTNALMDATDELSGPDDRTVRFRLKRPFPHLPAALAGPGGNIPAIMPERLAAETTIQACRRGRRQRPLPLSEGRRGGTHQQDDDHHAVARSILAKLAKISPSHRVTATTMGGKQRCRSPRSTSVAAARCCAPA